MRTIFLPLLLMLSPFVTLVSRCNTGTVKPSPGFLTMQTYLEEAHRILVEEYAHPTRRLDDAWRNLAVKRWKEVPSVRDLLHDYTDGSNSATLSNGFWRSVYLECFEGPRSIGSKELLASVNETSPPTINTRVPLPPRPPKHQKRDVRRLRVRSLARVPSRWADLVSDNFERMAEEDDFRGRQLVNRHLRVSMHNSESDDDLEMRGILKSDSSSNINRLDSSRSPTREVKKRKQQRGSQYFRLEFLVQAERTPTDYSSNEPSLLYDALPKALRFNLRHFFVEYQLAPTKCYIGSFLVRFWSFLFAASVPVTADTIKLKGPAFFTVLAQKLDKNREALMSLMENQQPFLFYRNHTHQEPVPILSITESSRLRQHTPQGTTIYLRPSPDAMMSSAAKHFVQVVVATDKISRRMMRISHYRVNFRHQLQSLDGVLDIELPPLSEPENASIKDLLQNVHLHLFPGASEDTRTRPFKVIISNPLLSLGSNEDLLFEVINRDDFQQCVTRLNTSLGSH